MYLEKLEIQGFKSFANKNILTFPGLVDKSKRGITSVVGPNGSGKSNVADAVRWALGEQSMKTLRGKKSEDVIFSGSDKKGKLGMAEVSMYLNNEDGRAPVDFSQIIITRRLYRNGDSEYMLNNSRVRLSDIQMLLAKAKFGQKTYSVIGQGMVEGFLNTTLSERKEFFDEATGVKQYQIKRDDALNKLRSSYENLIQAQMLINEIEPRLKSLTRQVNRLKKRDETEAELKAVQRRYYSQIWHDINSKFSHYNTAFLELEQDKFNQDKKLEQLNRSLEQLEKESKDKGNINERQERLNALLNKREELNTQLAKLEAQTEIKLEASGQFDLSFLLNKKAEASREVESIGDEIKEQEAHIQVSRNKDNDLQQDKEIIDGRIESLNKKLVKMGEQISRGGTSEAQRRLHQLADALEHLHEEEDPEKLRSRAREIKKALHEVIEILKQMDGAESGAEGEDWQDIQSKLSQLAGNKEQAMARINENNLRVTARTERVKLLAEKQKSISAEIDAIEQKLKKQSPEFDISSISQEQAAVKKKIADIQEEITGLKEDIQKEQAGEEAAKNRLFSLQRDIGAGQNEINLVNNKMNELKINSTRYETRLEDLEIEIRQEFGSLKEIKEYKTKEEMDSAEERENILQLKRKLELIGGIDPQVEEEYNQTKERFDFLDGQISDFTKAVDSLTKIIKELDVNIKEKFDKEFKVIAQNFEKYFKVLFNGGNAKIIKVMEEQKEEMEPSEGDEADKENSAKKAEESADLNKIKFLQKHNATGLAGIEISATPPGKKIKSISMLSGGERALTAIALICAIISTNPSPFVVLDEVDAALDEANSERLAKILDELAHKTQFIVVTHNRATMRRAAILYGVTMGDDGVSKLLSIKLEEASEQVKN